MTGRQDAADAMTTTKMMMITTEDAVETGTMIEDQTDQHTGVEMIGMTEMTETMTTITEDTMTEMIEITKTVLMITMIRTMTTKTAIDHIAGETRTEADTTTVIDTGLIITTVFSEILTEIDSTMIRIEGLSMTGIILTDMMIMQETGTGIRGIDARMRKGMTGVEDIRTLTVDMDQELGVDLMTGEEPSDFSVDKLMFDVKDDKIDDEKGINQKSEVDTGLTYRLPYQQRRVTK